MKDIAINTDCTQRGHGQIVHFQASFGCNVWTRFLLVIGWLKWLCCGWCHFILQQFIPWHQPLNEIVKSLYSEGGSSGRRTSQLYRHYLCSYHCYQTFQLDIRMTCYMIWWSSRWSLQTSGGHTRGPKLSETQLLVWLLLSSVISEINVGDNISILSNKVATYI